MHDDEGAEGEKVADPLQESENIELRLKRGDLGQKGLGLDPVCLGIHRSINRRSAAVTQPPQHRPSRAFLLSAELPHSALDRCGFGRAGRYPSMSLERFKDGLSHLPVDCNTHNPFPANKHMLIF
jgi:hypothetical protein